MTRRQRLLLAAATLLVLAPAAEMKDALKIDRRKPQPLQTLFGVYGYRARQTIVREADGYRIRLPAVAAGAAQTGVYSYFMLLGDCEVVVSYELIHLPASRQGYGVGVGVALDVGDEVGRGSLERLNKSPEGDGFAVQSQLWGTSGKKQDEYHFVPAKAKRGRLGLRRVKDELVYLAADTPDGPLEEIGRLPFVNRPVRAVRFYGDPGGSPTAIDVRVRGIEVRAEHIEEGAPPPGPRTWAVWIGTGIVVAGGGLGFWIWRRRQTDDEPPATVTRKKR
jgi:hypothetical protein